MSILLAEAAPAQQGPPSCRARHLAGWHLGLKMGYSIAIGERHDYDDGTAWVVLIKHMPEAPVDSCSMAPDHDGRSNSIAPCYSNWHDFCRSAGLYDLWMGDRGPLGRLDSSQPITLDVLREVDGVMERIHSLGRNDRRRLRWMHWWMHWAFDNCQSPVYG